ncbi:hypothetical protein AOA80_03440 [Methanomassiliicoccales archaeon RumEn M1]|nr:hypothetical protein AOA80_03440 [Methanomassiliicoccales archaeon RumEn M1]
MQTSKILMIGAAGLVAVLLLAGAVMAAGPNGMGDALGSDRDRPQDGSCYGAGCQERPADCDNDRMQQDRDRQQTCDGEGEMLRERHGAQHHASGNSDRLHLRDGSCVH